MSKKGQVRTWGTGLGSFLFLNTSFNVFRALDEIAISIWRLLEEYHRSHYFVIST